MPLKLNRPPGPSSRDIILPSEGFAYPELKGGNILVKAFTYDTESLMYGTSETPTKQYARLLAVLERIAVWPKGFKLSRLLEGDSSYVVMTARSLSYPDQRYTFETQCEHCSESESHSLRIPEELPQNRYPSDFKGFITLTTFNDNRLDMRFLTLEDDSECLRLSRERVAKKAILPEALDADYALSRLGFSLLRANEAKPESLEEAREFFRAMPFDEREETQRTLRQHTPGLSSQLTIRCPKCNQTYEAYMPMTIDFFRSGPERRVRASVERGFRANVFGPNAVCEGTDSPTEKSDVGILDPDAGGGEQTSPSGPEKPVMPPGTIQSS